MMAKMFEILPSILTDRMHHDIENFFYLQFDMAFLRDYHHSRIDNYRKTSVNQYSAHTSRPLPTVLDSSCFHSPKNRPGVIFRGRWRPLARVLPFDRPNSISH